VSPEVPLLAVAFLLPLGVYAFTGFRAGRRSARILDGLIAGAVAGVISGGIAGVSYVLFGKSVMNVAVGLLLGALGGAAVGAAGARLGMRGRAAALSPRRDHGRGTRTRAAR
jgi:hypothetical protein